ncbi:hypothetical protein Q8A67_020334 [Cirrhinus molitorella]|uniref:Uncharacterized protein n=1 Tax=Cirrhinus molitorella TaxID=172907 RepID=A0AA88PBN1_9TELE|nr:hypothetical protein Q8A67_020334 [Cirrhinus molitorella]
MVRTTDRREGGSAWRERSSMNKRKRGRSETGPWLSVSKPSQSENPVTLERERGKETFKVLDEGRKRLDTKGERGTQVLERRIHLFGLIYQELALRQRPSCCTHLPPCICRGNENRLAHPWMVPGGI